eukprot:3657834-Prymnesium_polylepis.4
MHLSSQGGIPFVPVAWTLTALLWYFNSLVGRSQMLAASLGIRPLSMLRPNVAKVSQCAV